MSEITIKAPHPGSTLKELVEACDSLIHIDKQFDEALLGEALAAMMPDTEVPAGWKSSPYPESSENHQIWCAAQIRHALPRRLRGGDAHARPAGATATATACASTTAAGAAATKVKGLLCRKGLGSTGTYKWDD